MSKVFTWHAKQRLYLEYQLSLADQSKVSYKSKIDQYFEFNLHLQFITYQNNISRCNYLFN